MPLFLSFIVALAITTACTPLLVRVAPRIGLTDHPGHRKVHTRAVPRVGGIAMAAGILIPAGALVPHLTPPVLGLLAGLLVLLVFGVWDDRVDLDYRLKFLGQFLAVGLCVSIGGVRIESLTLDAPFLLPHGLSWALTFIFLVGVTNAVNLSDGLDGLAGGLAFLCLCAIAVLAATTGNWTVTTVALIESGAILGFLRFNTHPARIFMGDGGSQMLGFSIGVLAILATQGESSDLSASLPLLLLGLPILDTLTVIVRRLAAGQSPFVSDRNHLHHRLLEFGFAHREAVLVIYCVQVALFMLAYFLRFQSDVVIVLVYASFAGVVLAALRWMSRSGRHPHSGRALPFASALLGRFRNPLLVAAFMRAASWTVCLGLIAYAAIVIASTRQVGGDISLLSVAMLVLLIVVSRFTSSGPVGGFERLPAYLSVILLVYLDQTAAARLPGVSWLSWCVIGLTAAGALFRFVFSERRFEVSALDILVVFVALVVPNLPGFISLPPDLPAGIVKAVLLLYVVEVMENMGSRRSVPRAVVAAMLAAITLRGLFFLVTP